MQSNICPWPVAEGWLIWGPLGGALLLWGINEDALTETGRTEANAVGTAKGA
jgi:hypothetical protein